MKWPEDGRGVAEAHPCQLKVEDKKEITSTASEIKDPRSYHLKWGTVRTEFGKINFFTVVIGGDFDKKFKSALRKRGNVFSVRTKARGRTSPIIRVL
jgi:hypothetical protein